MFPELSNFQIHSVFNLWNLETSQLHRLHMVNLSSWLQKKFKNINKISWLSLDLIFLSRTSILLSNMKTIPKSFSPKTVFTLESQVT